MAAKLNDGTEFSIPLKNLLGLIGGVAIGVWAYFMVTERISFLEHNYSMLMKEVEENDEWIGNFEPPKEVQETIKRVRELELEVMKLKTQLENHNGS